MIHEYFIKKYISSFITVSLLTFAFVCGVIMYISQSATVDFSQLFKYQESRYSVLLDDQGKEWARFQLDRRESIDYNRFPEHVIHAFLAAEDWHFFNHSGLSFKGIIRSVLINLYHGKKVQGGSTITQQLVKLLFFDSQKTFKRKIKEQVYALLIEQQCTKEQILQAYLNNVYFGCGIYGIEAAAQRFWGKSVKDVTISQAAVLAGTMKSPGNYCPLLYPLTSLHRRNVVLQSMRKLNFISDEEYETACAQDLELVAPRSDQIGLHAKELIRQYLEDTFGRNALYSGGLVVQTTFNKQLQADCECAFKEHVAQMRISMKIPIDGAAICMNHETGEIKAMVGGFDFFESKFNRAVQAKRQVGSIVKPFIYAQGLREGLSFLDTDIDEPFTYMDNGKVWAPGNYDRTFVGRITYAHALSHSNNILTIKLLQKISPQPVIELLKQAHIDEPLKPYLSLALGCFDTTLMKAMNLFVPFANQGYYVKPHYIKWIKNHLGVKVFNEKVQKEKLFDSLITGQVTSVLKLGMQRLSRRLNQTIAPFEIISKTGTTNDSRTCWFMASTPTITTGMYFGCDDNRSMGENVFPVHTAFPIFKQLCPSFDARIKDFAHDPRLHRVYVNKKTGEQVDKKTKGAVELLVA